MYMKSLFCANFKSVFWCVVSLALFNQFCRKSPQILWNWSYHSTWCLQFLSLCSLRHLLFARQELRILPLDLNYLYIPSYSRNKILICRVLTFVDQTSKRRELDNFRPANSRYMSLLLYLWTHQILWTPCHLGTPSLRGCSSSLSAGWRYPSASCWRCHQ